MGQDFLDIQFQETDPKTGPSSGIDQAVVRFNHGEGIQWSRSGTGTASNTACYLSRPIQHSLASLALQAHCYSNILREVKSLLCQLYHLIMLRYCLYKKQLPISYSKLLYKIGNYFLGIQYQQYNHIGEFFKKDIEAFYPVYDDIFSFFLFSTFYFLSYTLSKLPFRQ